MRIVRALLALAGVGLIGYGLLELLELPPRDLLSVALWAAALLILHDGVFAPLCLAAGHTVMRVLPRAWWPGALSGALAAVTVLALAGPVALPRPAGMGAANPSVLDRPYGPAVIGLLAAIGLAMLIGAVLQRVRGSVASERDRASDRT